MAANDINCYFYEGGNGISSAVDHGLAVGRPVAVTKRSQMMRHLHGCSPSVCIEDSSLKKIIANGISPLKQVLESCSNKSIINEVERCVMSLLS